MRLGWGVSDGSCVASHSACLLLRPRGETPVCSDNWPGPLLYGPDGELGGTLPLREGEPAARPPANQSRLARPPIWNEEGEEEGKEGKGVHPTSPPFAALPPQPPSPAWARGAAAGVLLGRVWAGVGRDAPCPFFAGPPRWRKSDWKAERGAFQKWMGWGWLGEGPPDHTLFTVLAALARAKEWL